MPLYSVCCVVYTLSTYLPRRAARALYIKHIFNFAFAYIKDLILALFRFLQIGRFRLIVMEEPGVFKTFAPALHLFFRVCAQKQSTLFPLSQASWRKWEQSNNRKGKGKQGREEKANRVEHISETTLMHKADRSAKLCVPRFL